MKIKNIKKVTTCKRVTVVGEKYIDVDEVEEGRPNKVVSYIADGKKEFLSSSEWGPERGYNYSNRKSYRISDFSFVLCLLQEGYMSGPVGNPEIISVYVRNGVKVDEKKLNEEVNKVKYFWKLQEEFSEIERQVFVSALENKAAALEWIGGKFSPILLKPLQYFEEDKAEAGKGLLTINGKQYNIKIMPRGYASGINFSGLSEHKLTRLIYILSKRHQLCDEDIFGDLAAK